MAEDYQLTENELHEIKRLAANEERVRLICLLEDGYDDALIDGWTSHHTSVHRAWKTAIGLVKKAGL